MKSYRQNPKLDATKTPTNLDVAWAAGIYEGEGSCMATGHGRRSYTLAVSQKDPELLYRLRDLFGGAIQYYDAVGKEGRFDVYRWNLCGDRGRVFLMAIYPFLTARRKVQIDATSAGQFVESVECLPVDKAFPSEAVASLKASVAASHQKDRELSKELRKAYQDKFYAERSKDPQWMEKRRKATAEWRAKSPTGVAEKVIKISS